MPPSASAAISVRVFQEQDRQAVVTLWQRCGLTRPWNDPDRDIDLATSAPASTILVGEIDATLTASVMVGFDGHRGWVYYLAVDPDHARKGYGRTMMRAAEAWLRDRNAPKLELMVRDDNAAATRFYERLGYAPQAVSVLGKWLAD